MSEFEKCLHGIHYSEHCDGCDPMRKHRQKHEIFRINHLEAENARLRECADILDKLRGMWIHSGWAADRCITALRACGYDQPDKAEIGERK